MSVTIRLPFKRIAGTWCFVTKLPRWLPGFVQPYQVAGPRSAWAVQPCPWWRDSRITLIVPLWPVGAPSAYRSRSMRSRRPR